VAKYVKERGIGLLMERELKYLGEELENPKKPFVVILGGAKGSDKIKVIDRLLERADTILIGGAMAYTFALAQGRKIGKSLSELDKVDIAKQALEKAAIKGVKFPVAGRHVHHGEFRFQGEDGFRPENISSRTRVFPTAGRASISGRRR